MARKDCLKIALVIALTIAAGSAYASSQITAGVAMGGGSFAPSNNVTIGVASTAGGYSVNSKHFNGDRVIGGCNTDPKMYFSSGAAVAHTVAAPAASDSYTGLSTTTGWTSL
jgi:hypothetical protein